MANEIYAAFDTTEGKFKVKLFADKAPNTVNNFVSLADGSKTGKVIGYISDIDIAKRGVYK